MTSDAKVGLLLGLVFIVIIAFLINGLPNLLRNNNDSESIVKNSIAAESTSSYSPKDQAERVANSFSTPAVKRTTASTQTITVPQKTIGPQSTTTRSYSPTLSSARQTPAVSSLPASSYSNTSTRNYQSGSSQPTVSVPAIRIPSQATTPADTGTQQQPANNIVSIPRSVTVTNDPSPVITHPTRTVSAASPVKKSDSKSYTVSSGDNLTKIAIKFYGKAEGSKYSNMMKIYEANKGVMKSPDSVIEGQKLTIPALGGQTGFTSTAPLSAPVEKTITPSVNSAKTVDYVVKEGDSLWTIAESKLGNGKRYVEISKLNKSALPNENSLKVGMKIKLPKY